MKIFRYPAHFVGQTIPEFINRNDASQFDLSDDGAHLVMYLNKPTREEITQITSANTEIRMTCFPDILWMTFKFGSLEWSEVPYTPHLSKQADLLNNLWNACRKLTVMLIDTSNGRVLHIGTVEFDSSFSAALRTGVALIIGSEFNKQAHDALCEYVKSNFDVPSIAEKAVVSFKFLAEEAY